MCRRNHLHGCCMCCLGLGLVLGQWIESGFFCFIAGAFLACIGVCLLRRK